MQVRLSMTYNLCCISLISQSKYLLFPKSTNSWNNTPLESSLRRGFNDGVRFLMLLPVGPTCSLQNLMILGKAVYRHSWYQEGLHTNRYTCIIYLFIENEYLP